MGLSKRSWLSGSTTVLALSISGPAVAQVQSSTSPAVTEQGTSQAATDPNAEVNSAGTADIIVTANKRSERALEVPGAITVFRGDDLLKSGMNSIKDFAGFTPGLQFNNGIGSGAPVIRGITEGIDTSPTVATVVNGAAIGSSSSLSLGAQHTLDLDPIDIERLEVLKGPQGTLYGANTLGGLISYTLREPNLTRFEGIARGELSGTEHGAPSYSIRGAVSTPIIKDELAVRVSAYYDRAGGFIDNDTRNIKNENHSATWGTHGSVRFEPSSRLKISLDGFYQHLNTSALDAAVYDIGTQRPRDGDLKYNEYVLPDTSKRIAAGILNVDHDMGFATLTSVTSLQRIHSDNGENVTHNSFGITLPQVLPLLGGVPFPAPGATQIDQVTVTHKTTEELRLTSPGNRPFSWIVGGFFNQEDNNYSVLVTGRTATGGVAPGLNPALDINLVSKLKEYSGFVNGTYKILPRLDITGGFRIGGIEQSLQQNFSGSDATAFNTLLALGGLQTIPAVSDRTKTSATVKTYLANIRYHFSPDGILFARYATGFRPGGPNLRLPGLPPTFNPDRTTNYEAGIKSRFWGGRGSIDVTGYYTQWKDIIVVINAGGIAGYTSGGDARIYGVESALSLRPVPELTLSATFAYSKGNITRADPAAATALAKGDALPYNPKETGSVAAEYRKPVSGEWTGYGSAAARFSSSRYSVFPSSSTSPAYKLPSYGLVDVHAGIESKRYTIDLFVKNVTDKRAQLAANSFYSLGEVIVQRPRTIGFALTAKY